MYKSIKLDKSVKCVSSNIIGLEVTDGRTDVSRPIGEIYGVLRLRIEALKPNIQFARSAPATRNCSDYWVLPCKHPEAKGALKVLF